MRSLPLVKTRAFTSGCSKRMRVQRVGELDVDAEVVRVELERVAGAQALVLAHVHDEARDGAAVLGRELEPPVAVAVGVGLEADGRERRVVSWAPMASDERYERDGPLEQVV